MNRGKVHFVSLQSGPNTFSALYPSFQRTLDTFKTGSPYSCDDNDDVACLLPVEGGGG